MCVLACFFAAHIRVYSYARNNYNYTILELTVAFQGQFFRQLFSHEVPGFLHIAIKYNDLSHINLFKYNDFLHTAIYWLKNVLFLFLLNTFNSDLFL